VAISISIRRCGARRRPATRPAAVLVPVRRSSEPTVLLTLRTAALPSHAGNCIPGGKIDPDDQTPVAAALREAHEEIGSTASWSSDGYLDLYLTFSGFRILPTLARVDPSFNTTLNRPRSTMPSSAARLPE